MLNEITIPNDYTGTIEQENTIVGKINENFTQLEEKISLLNESSLSFETHIVDYEEYEIDIYFSNNKSILAKSSEYINCLKGFPVPLTINFSPAFLFR